MKKVNKVFIFLYYLILQGEDTDSDKEQEREGDLSSDNKSKKCESFDKGNE